MLGARASSRKELIDVKASRELLRTVARRVQAGPDQSLDDPLGKKGTKLVEWMHSTRTFQKRFGAEQGETAPDDDFAARGFENVGAWIHGRNMFVPIRDEWRDDSGEV